MVLTDTLLEAFGYLKEVLKGYKTYIMGVVVALTGILLIRSGFQLEGAAFIALSMQIMALRASEKK